MPRPLFSLCQHNVLGSSHLEEKAEEKEEEEKANIPGGCSSVQTHIYRFCYSSHSLRPFEAMIAIE
jgi:hypothetical protein